MQDKKAILAVSFGTSHRDTCEKNIAAIEDTLRAAFPGWELRRAFTSGMIINKLWERDGIKVDTVASALQRLAAEGYTTVLVQPTHIINGAEHDDIIAASKPFQNQFQRFHTGAPLLTSTQDYRELCEILGREYPRSGSAVCLMGHGSAHYSDSAYAALDYHFKNMGYPHIFVGTVEGFPDLGTLIRAVKEYGGDQVSLIPLMVVAGDHVVNDMASDEKGSWKAAFAEAGFQTECIFKGLGEYPAVREMYVRHACEALEARA